MGSPPHARGKEPGGGCPGRGNGITPARAGKRSKIQKFVSIARDHPRTRGEKRLLAHAILVRKGSPPHARGKAASSRLSIAWIGITPARAGKRSTVHLLSLLKWDHPRTRGEKYVQRQSNTVALGSPPHARGKVVFLLFRFFFSGITPARAGKSSPRCLGPPLQQDHPRTRGEKK